MQIVRIIAEMLTFGAWSFRHAQGKPFIYPEYDLSYTATFLSMLFKMSERRVEADERLVKALDAVHPARRPRAELLHQRGPLERLSQVDPYSAVAARVAAPPRPAARRRQRGGAADAAPDRQARRTSPTSCRA